MATSEPPFERLFMGALRALGLFSIVFSLLFVIAAFMAILEVFE